MSKFLFQRLLCAFFFINCSLLISMTLASCADDDDDNGSNSASVDSVDGVTQELEYDMLRDLICLWTDAQRDELTGSWLSESYEPTVGHVLDESVPFERSLMVDDIDAADNYAIGALTTLGIGWLKPDGFEFNNEQVGSVSYNHSDDVNTFAVIDVNIKQLPHLSKLRLVKRLPENANDRPYYSVGDIVKYKNRYWVCTSEHKYKETARFINFTRDEDRSTGTFGWLGVGKDTVYNDQMASYETIGGWIENILLCDNTYNQICGVMADRGLNDNILEQMAPKNDNLRALLAEKLFNLTNQLFDVNGTSPIGSKEFWYTEGNRNAPDRIVAAPNALLLANKVRYSNGLTWDQWVPFVHCVWNKDFGNYYARILDDASQTSLSPSHFKWECRQVKSQKRFDIESGDFKQKDKYWICYNAVHWRHETLLLGYYAPEAGADMRTRTNVLLNFTADYTHHPKQLIRTEASRVPGNWITRNVTSREFTFTDKGQHNSDCEDIFVLNNLK